VKRRRVFVEGIAVSPGIAIGHVHLLDRRRVRYPKHHVDPDRVGDEIARLESAVVEAADALVALSEAQGSEGTDEGSLIINAHLMMMRDPLLLESARKEIETDLKCAEWALKSTVKVIRARFDALGHAYFRERRSDVDFIGERILAALTKSTDRPLETIPEDAVVVAHDLSPADVLSLLKKKVRALVTEVGGRTGHTAILARAMEIPAVTGCSDVLELAGRGDEIVVDGTRGQLILHPSRVVLAKYRGIARRRALLEEELLVEADFEPVTPDGHTVAIHANIDLEDDVANALAHGASGVGLYRTEFLYLQRATLPTLEDHVRSYRYVLEAMGDDRPVVMRTVDLGSDKSTPALRLPREENPALGLRACRLGLVEKDMFRAQLRALLVASTAGDLRIMFPMVSGVQELREVKELLDDVKEQLARARIPFDEATKVGIMIEVPSAVWVADLLAQECDFFCVGTNDLIQYTLAADRNNEHVAHLYRPLHPSMLRALTHIVDAGHDAGIPVSICGEMAAEPMHAAMCAALGFDSLSVPLTAIPRLKWAVRRFSLANAKALLDECRTLRCVGEVEDTVHRAMREVLPELIAPVE
jgi:phosphotransferase system enzyme I (PtsI)